LQVLHSSSSKHSLKTSKSDYSSNSLRSSSEFAAARLLASVRPVSRQMGLFGRFLARSGQREHVD
jgi:hypothetical protein